MDPILSHTGMKTFEEIPLGEIPNTIIENVSGEIVNYSIGFLEVNSHPRRSYDVKLLGSGTLVSINNIHAIVTAHHVISVLPQEGRLGLILDPTRQPNTIDIQGIAYIKIARGNLAHEGPDLGAVILSPSIASTIGAKKAFYNLDAERERILSCPLDLHDGFWIINGFIDERTIEEQTDDGGLVKRFFNMCGAGGPGQVIAVGNYDYYDFPVSYAGRSVAPRSFGGMSGGGLWQIPLKRGPRGEIVHKKPILSGVVFYQEPTTETSCGVKCHGRRSIYQVALEAIKGKTS